MRSLRVTLLAAPAALAIVLLAGCVPTTTEVPSSTGSPAPTGSSSSTPSPVATTPGDAVEGVPVDKSCGEILTPDTIYAFDPNFTAKDGYSPAAGSLGAQALADKGVACAWVQNTNGQLIELSVANLPEPAFTNLANSTFETSNAVPTYGVEGYFIADGGVGVAQAFASPYWIVLSSPAFFEPGDAEPLMRAAIAALG